MSALKLPPQITVFERGWLSSNNILICGNSGNDSDDEQSTALIDSGYGSHAQQTLHLVQHALKGKPLDVLVNTHLHSDHCGGNHALQQSYPNLTTLIPPGLAESVSTWDSVALSYEPTGQQCAAFSFSAVLSKGTTIHLGGLSWQVHAAPGHDTHSVILFEPASKTLVSADALWENGFGVVFPELEGEQAFQEVADTLDVIESLQAQIVIPGHGRVFYDAAKALNVARARLKNFSENPIKHAKYAAKVLLKFKLLEEQRLSEHDLRTWALNTPYFIGLHERYFYQFNESVWLQALIEDLLGSGAATKEGSFIVNA